MERKTSKDEDHASRFMALRAKLSDAEARLCRLYAAIESGIADATDIRLKDRVAAVKTERDIAQVVFDRAVAEMRPTARISAVHRSPNGDLEIRYLQQPEARL
jgi:site-specific DNA recombinase